MTMRSRDGGYGWVIVAAAWFNFLVANCVIGSFSILYISYTEGFQATKAATGWIGSLQYFMMGIVGLVSSRLTEKFGARRVCLIAAMVAGFGQLGASFAPNIYVIYLCNVGFVGPGSGVFFLISEVILQQWFTERRALASAIALSGIPLGFTISGPLISLLEEKYSWRGALIICSGLLFNVLVGASVLRTPPHFQTKIKKQTEFTNRETELEDLKISALMSNNGIQVLETSDTIKEQQQQQRKCVCCVLDTSLLKLPSFLIFLMSVLMANVGKQILMHHSPSRAAFVGIQKHLINYISCVNGLSQFLGRLIAGVVANLSLVSLKVLFGGSIVIAGILVVLVGLTGSSFVWLCAVIAGATFMEGFYLSVQLPLVTDIVGVYRIPKAAGFMFASFSISMLLVTPFAGWLFDVTQNYDIPYFTCGAIQCVGGLITLLFPFSYHHENDVYEVNSHEEDFNND